MGAADEGEDNLSRGLSDSALTGRAGGLDTVDETAVSTTKTLMGSMSLDDASIASGAFADDDMPVVRFGAFTEEKKGEDVWIAELDVKDGTFKAFGVSLKCTPRTWAPVCVD